MNPHHVNSCHSNSHHVNSCHRNSYIYHMNSSSIFWQYISIFAWAMSGEHLSPIESLKYLYLPNGVMMVRGSWLLLSSSNVLYCILMPSLVKNLNPEYLQKMSVIVSNGYCLRLMTLFSWCVLLIQHTLLSFFGMVNEDDAHSLSWCGAKTPSPTRWSNSFLKVFKWIQGTG